MKNKWLLILMICMISAALPALAGFDLKPYMYTENEVYPIDARTMLLMNKKEDSYDIELHSSGETMCSITVPRQDSVLSPFAWSDGRSGLIIEPEFGSIDVDRRFFLMERDGTLSQTYDLDDDLRFLRICGNGFAGLRKTDKGNQLVVMDACGKALFHREYTALADERLGLLDCVKDRDGTYFAAVCGEVMPVNGAQRIIITHFDTQGKVLFESEFAARYGYDAAVLAGDGSGGVYLVKTDDDQYKILQAFYLDSAGGMQWEKRIEAEGLILSAIYGEADAESGNLVIDGNAVSKSKGVYKTVRYTISRDGGMVSAEARDFSSRPDYGFHLNRAQDGTFFAMSFANYPGSKNTKLVVVPVDALPEIDPPTFKMY